MYTRTAGYMNHCRHCVTVESLHLVVLPCMPLESCPHPLPEFSLTKFVAEKLFVTGWATLSFWWQARIAAATLTKWTQSRTPKTMVAAAARTGLRVAQRAEAFWQPFGSCEYGVLPVFSFLPVSLARIWFAICNLQCKKPRNQQSNIIINWSRYDRAGVKWWKTTESAWPSYQLSCLPDSVLVMPTGIQSCSAAFCPSGSLLL